MNLTPVNHVELIISFLSIFSGIIVILLGTVYNKNIQSKEIKAGVIFNAGIGFYVFTSFVLYYIYIFIKAGTGSFLMTINDLSVVILISSLYYAVHQIIVKKKNYVEIWIGIFYLVIYVLIYQIVYFKFMGKDYKIENANVELLISLIETGVRLIALFIIVKAVVYLKKMENKLLKKQLKILGAVFILYLLVSLIEPALSMILVYFGINIYAIILLIKKIFQTETVNKEKESVAVEVLDLDETAEKYSLTSTEKEITALVYKGFTNAEIAEMRSITLSTVKRHVYNIFKKLDVSNRIEMVHLIKNE